MDCSRFQSDLVELVASTVSGPERDETIERLGAHAAGCEECRGSRELLVWSSQAADARDVGVEPDPAYWDSFNERVHRRIERHRTHRRSRLGWALAAAVLAGTAFLSIWALRPDRSVEIPSPDSESIAGNDVAADAPLEGLLGALDDWYGFDLEAPSEPGPEPDPGGALFPSTAGLDADARRGLLEWLREEEARLAGGAV